MEPLRLLSDATRASYPKLTNFGIAVAARMPRMTMTTINSIRVKPEFVD
jgi:hypothetical protein